MQNVRFQWQKGCNSHTKTRGRKTKKKNNNNRDNNFKNNHQKSDSQLPTNLWRNNGNYFASVHFGGRRCALPPSPPSRLFILGTSRAQHPPQQEANQKQWQQQQQQDVANNIQNAANRMQKDVTNSMQIKVSISNMLQVVCKMDIFHPKWCI